MTLLDYTVGGPDFRPDLFGLGDGRPLQRLAGDRRLLGTPLPTCHGVNFGSAGGTFNNIGGDDEIHGESGDDTIYAGCGNDVVFGDAQDDQVVLGWGADWASGGTGAGRDPRRRRPHLRQPQQRGRRALDRELRDRPRLVAVSSCTAPPAPPA